MRLPFALLVITLAPTLASASTWYVDVSNPNAPGTGTLLDPYTSIQYAIDRPTTVSGDTLLVRPGTYFGGLTFTTLLGPKELVVASTDGPLSTTLRPSTSASSVFITGLEGQPSRLRGFTITGFAPTSVTPVRIGIGALEDCVVTGNGFAGGFSVSVFCIFDAEITRCTVAGNFGGIGNQGVGGAVMVVRNSVAWGNVGNDMHNPGPTWIGEPNLIGTVLFDFGSPPRLTGDPLFWSLAGSDLRLRPGSPCIDAGNAAELDPDGSRRDLGALPYDVNYAPTPAVYCAGKLNSQGCVPQIAVQGVASATAPTPFLITCSNALTGRRGLLFYGYAPASVPFQGGTYCIQQPTRRVGGQVAVGTVGVPCSGTYSFDFNLRIQNGSDPGLVPGRGVYAQWWSIDPNDPAGFGTGLSNAVLFGIGP